MIAGREFVKMSGSGNDFVMLDVRSGASPELEQPAVIQAICDRRTGVGADGIVLLGRSHDADLSVRYYNRDGSLADLCGNATLCSTRLAVELGAAGSADFRLATDSGLVTARLVDGLPEIDLQPVTELVPDAEPRAERGEHRIGFARVGVPHLVILCDDVRTVDVVGRGRPLRHHASLRDGANVNFVSPLADGRWQVRTYERGVEGETLACGTGAVATAALLVRWGLADAAAVHLRTRSGKPLRVRLRDGPDGLRPSLSGEGRIVFRGTLGELEECAPEAPADAGD